MIKSAKYFIVVLMALLLTEGCGKNDTRPKNWPVTLEKENKEPYGTYLFNASMPVYWKHAKIETISKKFRYTSIDDQMIYSSDSLSMIVMLGLDYYITDEEWTQLKSFVSAGNELFIIAGTFDNKLSAEFGFNQYGGYEEIPLTQLPDTPIYHSGLRLMNDSTKTYGYSGKYLGGYFAIADKDVTAVQRADTTKATALANAQSGEEVTVVETPSEYNSITGPEVLGKNRVGANFIRYRFGQGAITLHTAPLAFSNYFLLQDGNRAYLDGIWHHFPANISHIYYNEYFKRSTEASDMSVLMKYPATKWAFIVGFATLLVYVLFGLKRRQRIVPVLKKVQNDSASFVETVGRLYYNKGNHANLAEKMIQHFLEWVRTYYYLDTTQLDESFSVQLQSKSGMTDQAVRDIVRRIHSVRLSPDGVTPEYLFDLNALIQSFYNNK